IGSGIWLTRDQRSSNGENITTRSDRTVHLAVFRLPCSHDKRRDNFDFPHYVWTKVRGKVIGLNDTERALVHFAAALQVFGWTLDGLRHMRVSGVGSAAAANVLATLLARPANEVRFALRPQGILRAAGLF